MCNEFSVNQTINFGSITGSSMQENLGLKTYEYTNLPLAIGMGWSILNHVRGLARQRGERFSGGKYPGSGAYNGPLGDAHKDYQAKYNGLYYENVVEVMFQKTDADKLMEAILSLEIAIHNNLDEGNGYNNQENNKPDTFINNYGRASFRPAGLDTTIKWDKGEGLIKNGKNWSPYNP